MVTNSAPEHFIPRSDSVGNLVESRFSDGDLDGGRNSHINNIVGPVRIGDCKDEGNGTLFRLSDIDKRVSVEVNLNGESNAHLLMETAGAFLQVADGANVTLLSLSGSGNAQLGANGGNGTKLFMSDELRQLVLQCLTVEPESAGVTALGISTKPFKRLFLDSTITDEITGNRTINKASGTVWFAGGGATELTVTNNLIPSTGSSFVFAVIRTNDATAVLKNVTVGSGAFTIRLQAPATNDTEVAFWVLN